MVNDVRCENLHARLFRVPPGVTIDPHVKRQNRGVFGSALIEKPTTEGEKERKEKTMFRLGGEMKKAGVGHGRRSKDSSHVKFSCPQQWDKHLLLHFTSFFFPGKGETCSEGCSGLPSLKIRSMGVTDGQIIRVIIHTLHKHASAIDNTNATKIYRNQHSTSHTRIGAHNIQCSSNDGPITDKRRSRLSPPYCFRVHPLVPAPKRSSTPFDSGGTSANYRQQKCVLIVFPAGIFHHQ